MKAVEEVNAALVAAEAVDEALVDFKAVAAFSRGGFQGRGRGYSNDNNGGRGPAYYYGNQDSYYGGPLQGSYYQGNTDGSCF